MYNAEIKRKTIELDNKRVLVDVEYQKDGARVSSEQFVFALDVTLDQVKQRVNSELKRFISADANLSAIAEGVVDLSTIPTVGQTQAEIDRGEWFRDFGRLERVTKLQELGGMPAAWATDLTALQAKVQAGAKKAYIADM
jgi:hypothetical protein